MKLKVAAAVVVLLAMIVTGCEPADESPAQTGGEEKIVNNPNDSKQTAAADIEPEDNSFCYVCHANFQGEGISLDHEVAGIGCSTCHGPSGAHNSDEDGLKPPDIMYTKQRIDSSCMKCHPTATSHPPKTCTDCHGDHVMASRTRRWDKDTGELIWDDGVRTDLQTIYGDDKPLVD